MNKLENILDESLLHSASGDRKALRLLLKKVIPDRFHYYHESRDITRQEEYADLLYKILLLELDEEEEESIELAELAYLGISECISSAPVHIYECLKKRIILMHYFADYFTDSLIAPNLTDEELTEAQLMHQVLYAYLKAKYRK